jgi:hypothetical protein
MVVLAALFVSAIIQPRWASAQSPTIQKSRNIFDFGHPVDPPHDDGLASKTPVGSTQPVQTAKAPQPVSPSLALAPLLVPTSQPVVIKPGMPAIPSAVEQAAASKEIDEVFADDLGKTSTPEQKIALAKKFLEAAAEERTNTAAKFVLLHRAVEYAVEGCDLATAFDAIDAEAVTFQIDAPREKRDAAAAIAKSPHTDRTMFVHQIMLVSAAALNLDEYALAEYLDDLALGSARQTKDQNLVDHITAQLRKASDGNEIFSKVQIAEAILQKDPQNPDANTKVGRFLCFYKQQWDVGLKKLNAGSDARLSRIAKLDMAHPADPSKKVAIGDGWWSFGDTETGASRTAAMQRAGKWYREAEPDLSGLTKLRVSKRIEQLDQMQRYIDQMENGAEELLPTMKGGTTEGDAIVLTGQQRLVTERKFHVPAEFKIVAMTDSTNIRFGYAADQIILNWEEDPNCLRIDGGPASGRHKNGAGKVPTNQWVEIVLNVQPDSLAITIDGQKRYMTKADFSAISDPLWIGPAVGSVVKVKSVLLLTR